MSCVRMRSDVFEFFGFIVIDHNHLSCSQGAGRVLMHSDALRYIWVDLDGFGRVRRYQKFLESLECFRTMYCAHGVKVRKWSSAPHTCTDLRSLFQTVSDRAYVRLQSVPEYPRAA